MKKNNQSTITDIHYDKLLRQEIVFCRKPQTIQECIQLLLKDPTIRLEQENEKLGYLLRGHEFFRLSDNQFLKECCQLMRFEQFQKNQVIFQKNDFDKNKVIIILTGDVVFNKGNQEMLHLKHFGSNLLILGSEYYADIPDWNVISKTPCKVAAISRHDFRVNLQTQELSRITKEISLLYSFPIFQNVPYSKVRKFYANSVTQIFQCLDIVYLQEQMIKQIYLVINGIFELRELEKGVAKAVHIYTQGQLIGENELNNQSSLKNGTAFCISEEGLLLLFDSQYFQEHVFPLIMDNIPRFDSVPKFKDNDSNHQIVSQTQELNQKRSISRQYNFKRSFDNLDINQNQPKKDSKFQQLRKSSQSFNSNKNSQQNLLENANQIFINNFQQQIGTQSQEILINPQQNSVLNLQELNKTTKRKSLKSMRISNDNNQQESNNIESPNRFIVNRQNQFLQTTQKLKPKILNQQPLQQQYNSRGTLNSELLNKFLNRKEEYGDIATKNRMRRTVSQTINVKKSIQINK